jgi:formate-dependent nitrite reductase membrane component NrfD
MNIPMFFVIGLIQGLILAYAIRKEENDKKAAIIIIISVVGTMISGLNILVLSIYTYLNMVGGIAKNRSYAAVISIIFAVIFASIIIL